VAAGHPAFLYFLYFPIFLSVPIIFLYFDEIPIFSYIIFTPKKCRDARMSQHSSYAKMFSVNVKNWYVLDFGTSYSSAASQWTTCHSLLSSWSQCFQTGWLAHSRTKVGVRETIKSFNLHYIISYISYISPKIFLYFSYILSFRIPIFLFFCQKSHWAPCVAGPHAWQCSVWALCITGIDR